MERDIEGSQDLDKRGELRVAARVTSSRYGDLGYIAGDHLEIGKEVIGHVFERVKAGVLFFYAFGTILAAFFERHAVSAAEGRYIFCMLKVAVRAKSPAVFAGFSSYIDRKMYHVLYIYWFPGI